MSPGEFLTEEAKTTTCGFERVYLQKTGQIRIIQRMIQVHINLVNNFN